MVVVFLLEANLSSVAKQPRRIYPKGNNINDKIEVTVAIVQNYKIYLTNAFKEISISH